jgi:hypothetical protein
MKTKVICVSTGRVPELTLHKIYDGFIFHPLKEDSTIQVVNDKNKVTTYKCERFMTLDEWRELKLNELGI